MPLISSSPRPSLYLRNHKVHELTEQLPVSHRPIIQPEVSPQRGTKSSSDSSRDPSSVLGMDHPRVHPGAPPAVNVELGHHQAAVYPPLPTAHDRPAMNQQHLGAQGPNTWVGNDANTLLVVATLITTLTYQLGTNIPGGYWQDTTMLDGKPLYRAGDPIMRDLHRPRYWIFMAASWVGFASSMVLTLSLLVRMAVDSRHVRWSFVVAYSSLVLTFIVSQPKTHLSIDIIVWVGVLTFLWLIISFRPEHRTRVVEALCCNHAD